MGARLILILALILAATQAKAQGLVFATSDPTVWIHSNFSGETITFFGNIEPDMAGNPPQGVFDVLIIVRGPTGDRVVRYKSRQFGIMLNADYALFRGLPSFYHVLSSRPLSTIIDPEVIATRLLTAEAQVSHALVDTTGDVPLFEGELIRLMENSSLFRTEERGVAFLSPTFFAARIALPSNVPNGVFLAHTFVLQDGQVVAERAQRFSVQKTGFERFLGETARNQPLLYGIACVLLALFTGWLGGVVFRR